MKQGAGLTRSACSVKLVSGVLDLHAIAAGRSARSSGSHSGSRLAAAGWRRWSRPWAWFACSFICPGCREVSVVSDHLQAGWATTPGEWVQSSGKALPNPSLSVLRILVSAATIAQVSKVLSWYLSEHLMTWCWQPNLAVLNFTINQGICFSLDPFWLQIYFTAAFYISIFIVINDRSWSNN